MGKNSERSPQKSASKGILSPTSSSTGTKERKISRSRVAEGQHDGGPAFDTHEPDPLQRTLEQCKGTAGRKRVQKDASSAQDSKRTKKREGETVGRGHDDRGTEGHPNDQDYTGSDGRMYSGSEAKMRGEEELERKRAADKKSSTEKTPERGRQRVQAPPSAARREVQKDSTSESESSDAEDLGEELPECSDEEMLVPDTPKRKRGRALEEERQTRQNEAVRTALDSAFDVLEVAVGKIRRIVYDVLDTAPDLGHTHQKRIRLLRK